MSVTAPANWDELLAQHQEITRSLMDRHDELLELVSRIEEPADAEPVQLTDINSVYESNAVPGTVSVGLLNPIQSALPVALGVFGSAGSPDAIQVNPGGLLVLPIRVGIVEVALVGGPLGTGNTLYAYLFRFKSVQAARKYG